MRWIIRIIFKFARSILGPIVLLAERLAVPKSVERTTDAQRQIDAATRRLALYQFKACPFCMKVRREIKRLSLKIELRDTLRNDHYREQLLHGGGRVKVPCLQVRNEDGNVSWLYESNDVIDYLRKLVVC